MMNRFSKAIAAIMLTTVVLFTAECMNAQTHKGHDYVDLNLPSGTLWATCNIGANAPEDYGNYFAWGETNTKSTYNWRTYKYLYNYSSEDDPYVYFSKYCNSGGNGTMDNLTTLQGCDDPATIDWGKNWCTPSMEQWEELRKNTLTKWTTRNGVSGRLYTASNGNSIFLPAAGYRWRDELYNAGRYGHYWSRSLDKELPSQAWHFMFGSEKEYPGKMFEEYRIDGCTVRPVCSLPQD